MNDDLYTAKDNLFLAVALFNTYIGLQNYERNVQQQENQKELEREVNKILKLLENESRE